MLHGIAVHDAVVDIQRAIIWLQCNLAKRIKMLSLSSLDGGHWEVIITLYSINYQSWLKTEAYYEHPTPNWVVWNLIDKKRKNKNIHNTMTVYDLVHESRFDLLDVKGTDLMTCCCFFRWYLTQTMHAMMICSALLILVLFVV